MHEILTLIKKIKKIIKQLEEADFHFTIIISVSLSMFV